jgi:eukaryotic-like serine/threonine-protein kinase
MLAPGTRLGPYEVVTLIGSGGMGEVYRARDVRLGRDVAVKVIRGAGARDAERLERFEQEARAAGLLNHPNVLAIYDIGTHGEAPYLVSELLEGETIRLRLVSGPLQPSKVLGFARQIADGLAAAHEKGIVHRDLKPENLFITKDGRVKILDFGLAKLVQTNGAFGVDSEAATADTSGPTVGTVSYMSPEQIRGQPVDHRSDIFSFGVVLYEMLTGRRAFQGASPVETMSTALKEDPPGLAELPAGMDLIVEHCVEKDPANRFQSAPDLAFHLKALTSASITGRRVPLSGRTHRAPILTRGRILSLLAVSALAGGAFLLGRRAGYVAPPSFHQLTFRRGIVLSARFAPDGQTVVYGAAWDGTPFQVFSTRPESPESRSLGFPNADLLAVSSTGELALSLGRHFVNGLETRGTLARVPFSGGSPREVLRDVESADWAPGGQSLAVIHVVRDRSRLEFPIGTVLYRSSGWLSHVRVSPDGEMVAFAEHPFRGDDRGDVCVIRAGSKEPQVLARGWSSVDGIAWRDDGREVWFTASELGPRTALFAADLRGRQRLVFRTPGRFSLADIRGDRVLAAESRFRLRVMFRREVGAAEQDLSWLDGSVGTDLSRDGTRILVAEQGSGVNAESYALYLRGTDGSPAVRLGDGAVGALSPDGDWVASVVLGDSPVVALLPTGAGESRMLSRGPVRQFNSVTWLPDGKAVLFGGSEPGQEPHLFRQGVGPGALPTPISGPGVHLGAFCRPVSPDGTAVVALDRDEGLVLLPLDRPETHPIPGAEPGDRPIGWSADGGSIYVFKRGELPAKVYRLDLVSGSRVLTTELSPPDRAGVLPPIAIQATPDGRTYSYTCSQTLSDLFIATSRE